MKARLIFSNSIYFALVFLVLYFEYLEVFGIKWAVLWKMILLAVVFFVSISHRRLVVSAVFVFGVLYAIKNLLNLSSSEVLFENLVQSSKLAIIPLTIYLLDNNFFSKENSYIYIKKISWFILLSFLPFYLGLVAQKNAGYDLSIFGLDSVGLVGVFQTPHAASITTSIAATFFSYMALNSNKHWKYIFITTACVFIMSATFVRTGLVAYFIALFYLLCSRFGFKKVAFFSVLPALFLSLLYAAVPEDNLIKMRINGTNSYMVDNEGDAGSGRLTFSAVAFANWKDSEIGGLVFGLGEFKAKNAMEAAIGMRVYAHNGFMDVLQFNGLIGVLIYLVFLFFLIKRIQKSKDSLCFELSIGFLILYLVTMFLQGERFFIFDVAFGVSTFMLYSKKDGDLILSVPRG